MHEKKHNNCKESKIFINLAYIYITLPFVIFILGWVKWYYAIFIVGFVVASLIKTIHDTDSVWIPDINKTNIMKVFIILVIITSVVYLSGIGNRVWQNYDHSYRNTIFRILVEDKWPLISYEWNPNGSGLIYYIGFWLPSAIIGKITNLDYGYYFQMIWAAVGICFVYYLICAWLKRLIIWPLIIFLLFSGLDIIGYIAASKELEQFNLISHIEWWAGKYQYSSIITQLFWVFNQAIPTWCITILLFMQKNTKNVVYLLALSMLSSTLPFIGLIPYVIYITITKSGVDIHNVSRANINNSLKKIVLEVCSFQNILGGGIIGIISFLYLKGNSAGQYIESLANEINIINFLVYYLFCFLEVGIYLLIIYKYQVKNSLFYFIGVCLFIIPLIKVGTSADFCMRASIPAMLILILLIIDTLIKAKEKRDIKTIVSLLVILLIGSVTPALEINRTVYETYSSIKEKGNVDNDEVSRKNIYIELNFSGRTKDNVFFEIFVK